MCVECDWGRGPIEYEVFVGGIVRTALAMEQFRDAYYTYEQSVTPGKNEVEFGNVETQIENEVKNKDAAKKEQIAKVYESKAYAVKI